jgi:hypothetical protein
MHRISPTTRASSYTLALFIPESTRDHAKPGLEESGQAVAGIAAASAEP